MKTVYPYPDKDRNPRIDGYLWHVVFTVKRYMRPIEIHEVSLHLVHYSSDAMVIRNVLENEYSDYGKRADGEMTQTFDELKSATFMGMVQTYTVP